MAGKKFISEVEEVITEAIFDAAQNGDSDVSICHESEAGSVWIYTNDKNEVRVIVEHWSDGDLVVRRSPNLEKAIKDAVPYWEEVAPVDDYEGLSEPEKYGFMDWSDYNKWKHGRT